MISGPPLAESARYRGLSSWQAIVLTMSFIAAGLTIWRWPESVWTIAHVSLAAGFGGAIILRLVALMLGRSLQEVPVLAEEDLPHYTILVALHDEAALIPQLFDRLRTLSYPTDRLKGYVLLEPTDPLTLAAALLGDRPDWLDIVVAPPGGPMTKPRALNVGLALAAEGLICVYDAEDWPDPNQLREAAARLSTGASDLACVQAPLRIRSAGQSWLARQFSAEYAALFEVLLPALARMGLPLPLGGTSNHFRTDALRRVGAWDAWNVTEDADLGFRLARHGYRTATISLPTYESPPTSLDAWVPQRTRWLKGFMQTWGVHARSWKGHTWRTTLSLSLMIGLPIVSALTQAFVMLGWLAMAAMVLVSGASSDLPLLDMAFGAAGWLSASACCWTGSRRAGLAYRIFDAVTAPIYWALTTVAAWRAVVRLVTEPFYWDKTPHVPDPEASEAPGAMPDLSGRARVAT